MSLLVTLLLCGCLMLPASSFDPSPCPPGFFLCSSRCVPLSSRCDGSYDCDDRSDELWCPPRCSLTLRDFYGVFTPPGYPGTPPSPPPPSCSWHIDSGDGRGLSLSFSAVQLSDSDALLVYEARFGDVPDLLRALDRQSNGKSVTVESAGGRVLVIYQYGSDSPGGPVTPDSDPRSSGAHGSGSRSPASADPVSEALGSRPRFAALWSPAPRPRGFNATYRVRGFCLPWDNPCGNSPGLLRTDGGEEGGGCYTDAQKCDGTWDCTNGRDESKCLGCTDGHFPCAMGRACYPPGERCNYQTSCQDGTDERGCRGCQPGGFHCDLERCVYEAWVCDGQADCRDGSDEAACSYILPRKVIAAAVIGSLICATLLVVALGCTCRLYSTRAREYSVFAPLSRMDAELIQQQAPPSYGQLIAQGAIPPVPDFPTESPSDGSLMGNLRSLFQLLHQTPAPPLGGALEPLPRRRPPRPIRRLLRRLRRWGLLPPRTPGSQADPPLNQTSSPPEGTSENGNLPSAPLLPVKTPLEPAHSSSPQTDAPAPPPLHRRGLMGMMQAVRGRILHPLGVEVHEEESGEPETGEEEDEMLLMPLPEGAGAWEGAAGDVGLIVC